MERLLNWIIGPVVDVVRYCVLKPIWGKEYALKSDVKQGPQAGPPWYGCNVKQRAH